MTYNEQTALDIIDFWRKKGLSDYAISGWLSNWYVESGLRSDNAQNSYMTKYGITDEEYIQRVDNNTWAKPDTGDGFDTDRIGFGYSQWTSSGRKSGLHSLVKSKGVSIADSDTQMEWAYTEYTSPSYKNFKQALDASQDAGDCAVIIMTMYEKPASKDDPAKQQLRRDYANEFYNKYFAGEQPTKKDKILALSAGHYLYTAGKRCLKSIDPSETREWVLNARIADMLMDRLAKYDGVKVIRLDDPTGETPITLAERAQKSDAHNANFYLAIHHNAGINGGAGGGVTVYHYPLDRNKEQATALYNDVVSANGLKGNRATPIKATTELYEVAVPEADSILLENGFMDSTTDTPIILTKAFAEKTADGLCKFFVDMWGLKLKKDYDPSDILAEIESIRNNIKALEERLKELEALVRG